MTTRRLLAYLATASAQEVLFQNLSATSEVDVAAPVPNFKCPPQIGGLIQAGDPLALPLRGHPDAFLPVYRRKRGGGSPRLAIVQLHGAQLDGDFYFGQMLEAMPVVINEINPETRGKAAVIVAPVFGNFACTKDQWLRSGGQRGTAAVWSDYLTWFHGKKSDAQGDWKGISSYEALDDVVLWLESEYHALEKIVVIGFSAGAMMGLKWSILSPLGMHGKTEKGTLLRTIVASPSSVLYLDSTRPAKTCSSSNHVTSKHKCHDFLVPNDHDWQAADTCSQKWNRYPFGLDRIDHYIGTAYVGDRSVEELRAGFATKDFWLGVGNKDVVPCEIGGCNPGCRAETGGYCRLQRILNYVSHLRRVLPHYKPRYQIFNGGHGYFNVLWGSTQRPKMNSGFFENAFNGWTSEKSIKCSVEPRAGVGLSGVVLAKKSLKSRGSCCSYCDSLSACRAWAHADGWSECSLFSEVQGEWPSEQYVVGIKNSSKDIAIGLGGNVTDVEHFMLV